MSLLESSSPRKLYFCCRSLFDVKFCKLFNHAHENVVNAANIGAWAEITGNPSEGHSSNHVRAVSRVSINKFVRSVQSLFHFDYLDLLG